MEYEGAGAGAHELTLGSGPDYRSQWIALEPEECSPEKQAFDHDASQGTSDRTMFALNWHEDSDMVGARVAEVSSDLVEGKLVLTQHTLTMTQFSDSSLLPQTLDGEISTEVDSPSQYTMGDSITQYPLVDMTEIATHSLLSLSENPLSPEKTVERSLLQQTVTPETSGGSTSESQISVLSHHTHIEFPVNPIRSEYAVSKSQVSVQLASKAESGNQKEGSVQEETISNEDAVKGSVSNLVSHVADNSMQGLPVVNDDATCSHSTLSEQPLSSTTAEPDSLLLQQTLISERTTGTNAGRLLSMLSAQDHDRSPSNHSTLSQHALHESQECSVSYLEPPILESKHRKEGSLQDEGITSNVTTHVSELSSLASTDVAASHSALSEHPLSPETTGQIGFQNLSSATSRETTAGSHLPGLSQHTLEESSVNYSTLSQHALCESHECADISVSLSLKEIELSREREESSEECLGKITMKELLSNQLSSTADQSMQFQPHMTQLSIGDSYLEKRPISSSTLSSSKIHNDLSVCDYPSSSKTVSVYSDSQPKQNGTSQEESAAKTMSVSHGSSVSRSEFKEPMALIHNAGVKDYMEPDERACLVNMSPSDANMSKEEREEIFSNIYHAPPAGQLNRSRSASQKSLAEIEKLSKSDKCSAVSAPDANRQQSSYGMITADQSHTEGRKEPYLPADGQSLQSVNENLSPKDESSNGVDQLRRPLNEVSPLSTTNASPDKEYFDCMPTFSHHSVGSNSNKSFQNTKNEVSLQDKNAQMRGSGEGKFSQEGEHVPMEYLSVGAHVLELKKVKRQDSLQDEDTQLRGKSEDNFKKNEEPTQAEHLSIEARVLGFQKNKTPESLQDIDAQLRRKSDKSFMKKQEPTQTEHLSIEAHVLGFQKNKTQESLLDENMQLREMSEGKLRKNEEPTSTEHLSVKAHLFEFQKSKTQKSLQDKDAQLRGSGKGKFRKEEDPTSTEPLSVEGRIWEFQKSKTQENLQDNDVQLRGSGDGKFSQEEDPVPTEHFSVGARVLEYERLAIGGFERSSGIQTVVLAPSALLSMCTPNEKLSSQVRVNDGSSSLPAVSILDQMAMNRNTSGTNSHAQSTFAHLNRQSSGISDGDQATSIWSQSGAGEEEFEQFSTYSITSCSSQRSDRSHQSVSNYADKTSGTDADRSASTTQPSSAQSYQNQTQDHSSDENEVVLRSQDLLVTSKGVEYLEEDQQSVCSSLTERVALLLRKPTRDSLTVSKTQAGDDSRPLSSASVDTIKNNPIYGTEPAASRNLESPQSLFSDTSSTSYQELPNSINPSNIAIKPKVSVIAEASFEEQAPSVSFRNDTDGPINADVQKILERYGEVLSDDDHKKKSVRDVNSHHLTPTESVAESNDTQLTDRMSHRLTTSREHDKSYLYEDPARSITLALASGSTTRTNTPPPTIIDLSGLSKSTESLYKGGYQQSSSQLKKMHELSHGEANQGESHGKASLTETEVDNSGGHGSISSNCSSHSGSVNYDVLQNDLEEIQRGLAILQKGELSMDTVDIRSTESVSRRMSNASEETGSKVTGSEVGTPRKFSWDYGDLTGEDLSGYRFVTSRSDFQSHVDHTQIPHGETDGISAKMQTTSVQRSISTLSGEGNLASIGAGDEGKYTRIASELEKETSPQHRVSKFSRETIKVSSKTPVSKRYDFIGQSYESLVRCASDAEVEQISIKRRHLDNDKTSMSQKMHDLMARGSPQRQAYKYLAEAEDSMRVVNAQKESRLHASDTDIHGSPSKASSESSSLALTPIPKRPFRAFGNLTSFLNTQLDKMSSSAFDTSIELRSPLKQDLDKQITTTETILTAANTDFKVPRASSDLHDEDILLQASKSRRKALGESRQRSSPQNNQKKDYKSGGKDEKLAEVEKWRDEVAEYVPAPRSVTMQDYVDGTYRRPLSERLRERERMKEDGLQQKHSDRSIPDHIQTHHEKLQILEHQTELERGHWSRHQARLADRAERLSKLYSENNIELDSELQLEYDTALKLKMKTEEAENQLELSRTAAPKAGFQSKDWVDHQAELQSRSVDEHESKFQLEDLARHQLDVKELKAVREEKAEHRPDLQREHETEPQPDAQEKKVEYPTARQREQNAEYPSARQEWSAEYRVAQQEQMAEDRFDQQREHMAQYRSDQQERNADYRSTQQEQNAEYRSDQQREKMAEHRSDQQEWNADYRSTQQEQNAEYRSDQQREKMAEHRSDQQERNADYRSTQQEQNAEYRSDQQREKMAGHRSDQQERNADYRSTQQEQNAEYRSDQQREKMAEHRSDQQERNADYRSTQQEQNAEYQSAHQQEQNAEYRSAQQREQKAELQQEEKAEQQPDSRREQTVERRPDIQREHKADYNKRVRKSGHQQEKSVEYLPDSKPNSQAGSQPDSTVSSQVIDDQLTPKSDSTRSVESVVTPGSAPLTGRSERSTNRSGHSAGSRSSATSTSKNNLRPYRPPGSNVLYYVDCTTDDGNASVTNSETTIESTHIGSDDFRPPQFPSHWLGSRPDPPPSGTCIYPIAENKSFEDAKQQEVSSFEDKTLTEVSDLAAMNRSFHNSSGQHEVSDASTDSTVTSPQPGPSAGQGRSSERSQHRTRFVNEDLEGGRWMKYSQGEEHEMRYMAEYQQEPVRFHSNMPVVAVSERYKNRKTEHRPPPLNLNSQRFVDTTQSDITFASPRRLNANRSYDSVGPRLQEHFSMDYQHIQQSQASFSPNESGPSTPGSFQQASMMQESELLVTTRYRKQLRSIEDDMTSRLQPYPGDEVHTMEEANFQDSQVEDKEIETVNVSNSLPISTAHRTSSRKSPGSVTFKNSPLDRVMWEASPSRSRSPLPPRGRVGNSLTTPSGTSPLLINTRYETEDQGSSQKIQKSHNHSVSPMRTPTPPIPYGRGSISPTRRTAWTVSPTHQVIQPPSRGTIPEHTATTADAVQVLDDRHQSHQHSHQQMPSSSTSPICSGSQSRQLTPALVSSYTKSRSPTQKGGRSPSRKSPKDSIHSDNAIKASASELARAAQKDQERRPIQNQNLELSTDRRDRTLDVNALWEKFQRRHTDKSDDNGSSREVDINKLSSIIKNPVQHVTKEVASSQRYLAGDRRLPSRYNEEENSSRRYGQGSSYNDDSLPDEADRRSRASKKVSPSPSNTSGRSVTFSESTTDASTERSQTDSVTREDGTLQSIPEDTTQESNNMTDIISSDSTSFLQQSPDNPKLIKLQARILRQRQKHEKEKRRERRRLRKIRKLQELEWKVMHGVEKSKHDIQHQDSDLTQSTDRSRDLDSNTSNAASDSSHVKWDPSFTDAKGTSTPSSTKGTISTEDWTLGSEVTAISPGIHIIVSNSEESCNTPTNDLSTPPSSVCTTTHDETTPQQSEADSYSSSVCACCHKKKGKSQRQRKSRQKGRRSKSPVKNSLWPKSPQNKLTVPSPVKGKKVRSPSPTGKKSSRAGGGMGGKDEYGKKERSYGPPIYIEYENPKSSKAVSPKAVTSRSVSPKAVRSKAKHHNRHQEGDQLKANVSESCGKQQSNKKVTTGERSKENRSRATKDTNKRVKKDQAPVSYKIDEEQDSRSTSSMTSGHGTSCDDSVQALPGFRNIGINVPTPISISPPRHQILNDVTMVSEAVQTSFSTHDTALAPGMGEQKVNSVRSSGSTSDPTSKIIAFEPVSVETSNHPENGKTRKAQTRSSSISGPTSKIASTQVPTRTGNWPEKESPVGAKTRTRATQAGLAWYIPLKEQRPWHLNVRERQAHALSKETWSPSGKSWRDIYHLDGNKGLPATSDAELYLARGRYSLNNTDGTNSPKMSLQEAFERKRQDFISVSRERQKHLMLKAEERRIQALHTQHRHQLFCIDRKLDPNKNAHPYSDNLFHPKKRMMTKKEMKDLTNKKYATLEEVRRHQYDAQREDVYRANRLRAQNFKYKVLSKVLHRKGAWVD